MPQKLLRVRIEQAMRGVLVSFILVLSLPAQQLSAQPLTLRDAVRIALEKNPQHKMAVADSRAASDDIGLARSNLLPHLTFSETATRGNDPV